MFLKRIGSLAAFTPGKMSKQTLFQGESLLAGLNCFEAGQEHALHSHQGQDKLYFVVEGNGEVRIGDRTENLTAGDAAFAPSGVPHAIHNTGPGRLIVMAVFAPPPTK